MTGHVTWDDNIGNVFDNVTDAVDDAAKNVGAAFGKAKGALETFFRGVRHQELPRHHERSCA